VSHSTAQARPKLPLVVPIISQWSHHYCSGLDLAQTAGTKTLPRPHCGPGTHSRAVTHAQPPEPLPHRLTQELTWRLGSGLLARPHLLGWPLELPVRNCLPTAWQQGIFPAQPSNTWNSKITKPDSKKGNSKNVK
jgi:hypothetical protein